MPVDNVNPVLPITLRLSSPGKVRALFAPPLPEPYRETSYDPAQFFDGVRGGALLKSLTIRVVTIR